MPFFSHIGAKVTAEGLFWFPFEQHLIDTPYDLPRVYFVDHDDLEFKGRSRLKNNYISGEVIDTFGTGRAFLQEANKPTLTELKIFFRSDVLKEGRFVEFWGQKWTKKGQGDQFTVSGFRIPEISEPRQEKVPLPPTPYRSGDRSQNRQRVTVEGHWAGGSRQEFEKGYLTLSPDDGGANLRVVLPNSISLIGDELLDAQRLRVTGYLQLETKLPHLFPRYSREIEVLGKPHWASTAAFRWLAAGTLAVALGGLIWVVSLRRVVRSRTEALDNSLGLLNASYDAVHEGICVIDSQGSVRKTNPRFWKMLGIDESDLESLVGDQLGARIAESFDKPAKFHELWNQLLNDGEAKEEGHLSIASSEDGELRFYTVPAKTGKDERELGRVWVFKDMTDQRRLESTLMQSQKMEALGRLAGGVAHDFNNLLTGILGNLNVARLDPAVPVGNIEKSLDAAERAGHRASNLIKNLLGFSRQEKLISSPSCANLVVSQLVTLVSPTLSPKVTLLTELEEGLHLAEFDPTQLEQVILNMVMNAHDAIGAKEGEIVIATESIEATHPDSLIPERYVCISVSDNGGGMSESIRSRIFEPFFTTKDAGKGTGLGLATAYGIIKQMEGWIDCESQLGEGTVFRIYLAELSEVSQTPLPCEAKPLAQPAPQLERQKVEVLCVDDEEVVRQVTEGVLGRAGFRTATAEHGREALDLLAERKLRGESLPDLILTDLTMPVMDGKELLKEVRLGYPDLPVIICSGYFVDCDEVIEGADTRLDGFIEKPYEPAQMVEEIERVLKKRTRLETA